MRKLVLTLVTFVGLIGLGGCGGTLGEISVEEQQQIAETWTTAMKNAGVKATGVFQIPSRIGFEQAITTNGQCVIIWEVDPQDVD